MKKPLNLWDLDLDPVQLYQLLLLLLLLLLLPPYILVPNQSTEAHTAHTHTHHVLYIN